MKAHRIHSFLYSAYLPAWDKAIVPRMLAVTLKGKEI